MGFLMKLLCFFGLLLLVALLISFVPIGVLLKYSPEGAEFHFTLWKKSFVLYPVVEKKQKKTKKIKKKSAEDQVKKAKPPQKKKAKAPSDSGKKQPDQKPEEAPVKETLKLERKKSKGSQGGKTSHQDKKSAEELITLAKAFLPFFFTVFQRLGQYKKIDRLELDLVIGSPDPVEATILYGKAHALLGTLWLPLDCALNIQQGRARVQLDFEAMQPQLYGVMAFSITIGQIVRLLCYIGLGSYQILGKK